MSARRAAIIPRGPAPSGLRQRRRLSPAPVASIDYAGTAPRMQDLYIDVEQPIAGDPVNQPTASPRGIFQSVALGTEQCYSLLAPWTPWISHDVVRVEIYRESHVHPSAMIG
jgi:hypothetical protein